MKALRLLCVGLLPLISATAISQPRPVDRMTASNGKKLHFHILEGRKDDIILFESGGGDDSSVWSDLLAPIAEATGATLITYDRPGLGSSEVDPQHHGLTSDVERLELGLQDLGYTGHYKNYGLIICSITVEGTWAPRIWRNASSRASSLPCRIASIVGFTSMFGIMPTRCVGFLSG